MYHLIPLTTAKRDSITCWYKTENETSFSSHNTKPFYTVRCDDDAIIDKAIDRKLFWEVMTVFWLCFERFTDKVYDKTSFIPLSTDFLCTISLLK